MYISPQASRLHFPSHIKVCQELHRAEGASGSTAAVAVYDGSRKVLTLANVGDSLCVLSRGGRAVRMHRTHRLGRGAEDSDERKRVEAAGGRIINSRVNGVLSVSRAFGDISLKDYSGGTNVGLVLSVPGVVQEVITPMTEFAVIGTDGLWDAMEPQQVVNFLRSKVTNHHCDCIPSSHILRILCTVLLDRQNRTPSTCPGILISRFIPTTGWKENSG